MARLRFVLFFCLCAVTAGHGEGIYNIVGDPLEFPATESCQTIGSKLEIERTDDNAQTVPVPVALWRDGGWKPEAGYTDRMSPNTSVILNTSNILDEGLYALTCGASKKPPIQVYVVEVFEKCATEGENVTLSFHFDYNGGKAKFIRCEKDGELVSEVNVSSRNISYGRKYEERASVSPSWRTQGDFSVTLQDVRLQEEGDYFFYTAAEDGKKTKEKLVAIRMKVMEARPALPPREREEEEKMGALTIIGVTAIAIVVLGCLVFVGFCIFKLYKWCKSRRPNVPPAPGVEMGLLHSGPDERMVGNGGPEM